MSNEYFEKLYESTADSLKNSIHMYQAKTGNIPYIVMDIEYRYKTLAITSFCLNRNTIMSKKSFYKSTLAREWVYKTYESKEYEISNEEVSTYVYESLLYAILSGSTERAKYMAELFGGRKEAEKDDFFSNILLGYGLKYVILDDKEKAYEYINKLEEAKDKRGMKQYYNGERRVYKGLVDRDENEFNEGLSFLLKNHVSRMKRNGNTLEQYFAYNSIAYGVLAKERGIKINVKHELFPMEFLEDTDIDYSKITIFE